MTPFALQSLIFEAENDLLSQNLKLDNCQEIRSEANPKSCKIKACFCVNVSY